MLDLDTWESLAEAQQARLMGGHRRDDAVLNVAALQETHLAGRTNPQDLCH